MKKITLCGSVLPAESLFRTVLLSVLLFTTVLFIFTGCPSFDKVEPLAGIKIFFEGTEQTGITIARGETANLTAALIPQTDDVFISWEISSDAAAAITSSGKGPECSIKGLTAGGQTTITVKAWRNTLDVPVEASVSVSVTEGQATGIIINGPPSISVGKEEFFIAEFDPPWIDLEPVWSANPSSAVTLNGTGNSRGITGILEGTVTITVSAGGLHGYFSLEITPEVIVTQRNPVAGIKIFYDNNIESLPVSNVIWLQAREQPGAAGDEVRLKVVTAGGEPDQITWTGANDEVDLSVSPDGKNCALTGKKSSVFDLPPTELRVSARNADNGEPVSVIVLVKTQPEPIWAWDRARDADINTALDSYVSPGLPMGPGSPPIHGRGTYGSEVPIIVKANQIPYTTSGLWLNSSNNDSGRNPSPADAPGNSTRITIGSSENTDSIAVNSETNVNLIPRGVFDFLDPFYEKNPDGTFKEDDKGLWIVKEGMRDKSIRVSVDYEIVWTAGAGRDLWINVNNNYPTATRSTLSTASQMLIEPLTAARGTRTTALATMDVIDLVTRKVRNIPDKDNPARSDPDRSGWLSLDRAFISFVCLSNGGSIYVSGIRIEFDE